MLVGSEPTEMSPPPPPPRRGDNRCRRPQHLSVHQAATSGARVDVAENSLGLLLVQCATVCHTQDVHSAGLPVAENTGSTEGVGWAHATMPDAGCIHAHVCGMWVGGLCFVCGVSIHSLWCVCVVWVEL